MPPKKDKTEKSQKDKSSINHYFELSIPDNKNFQYVFKKTERVASALYMVSGFIESEDPLRKEIRKSALLFLTDIHNLKEAFSSNREVAVNTLRERAREIISLLDVGRFAGLISEMNATILREEIVHLVADTQTFFVNEADNGSSFHVTREFLRPDMEKDRAPILPERPSAKNIKDNIKDKTEPRQSPARSAVSETKRTKPEEKKENRRKQILDIITKKGGQVTIKDISAVVSGYSEKTIQRELLSLVDQGVLEKSGERRWSRYSLVNNH